MATENTPSERIADDGPVSRLETPRHSAGWFVDFSRALFNLSLTLNRTFTVLGVVALGAIAVAYWGAYTGRDWIAVGAMAVVGLAMLAYTAATAYMLWTVITGLIKWKAGRRAGHAPNVTDSGPE